MKTSKSLGLPFLLLIGLLSWQSCEKEDEQPSYEIPTTYNFENVSYSGQTQRLAQLLEMKAYMGSANTQGVALDAAKLKAMFSNDAANADWTNTYDASKQLKSKTFENQREIFEALMDELALASQSTVDGAEGQSGVVASLDGSKSYLLGNDGLEHAQLIEKGLMGACFYYQATAVYMGADRMNVDNETVEPGEGTKMEHHWDEAFGYYGVPKDFPTSKDGIVFWGTYSDRRDPILGSNGKLMGALLKGRAAISNKDLATRDEAIKEAQESWELITVGTALHYLNSALTNFDDMALRAHALSEAIAFTYSVQFNPNKRISNTQVAELLTLMAGSESFDQMNLYQLSKADVQQAKDLLASYYNLEESKDDF